MSLIRLLLLLLLPTPLWAGNVTVFAAASLKTALEQVAADWQDQTGHSATLSFAGSSALARQIEAGAPADIFISANPGWMDHLAAKGLIHNDTRGDLLSNTLVLIGPAGATPLPGISAATDLAGLLGDNRIAMALTEAVPAGIYGKAALETLGLWPSVAESIAQTDNVRAALALVAMGETPMGITYGTDAVAEPRVSVLATFADTSHPPILYPAAIITDSATALSYQFLGYLQSPAAARVFEDAGFIIPEAE
ncbi:molybdate ABC transporter substrate-binding protein [Thalassovita sp.]|uniref:molybdate ABC transporter substrate-binding protein n=1 Tax=Thalassovita sp. TaxID=1979401 RepID=UPI00288122AC|nr:molybdate ABC transporter substrate-binding protein [Thalassovita sp.]MDF1804084.1 molybdate ABC transporter substrate-binding protein [Thalassovita sp.]